MTNSEYDESNFTSYCESMRLTTVFILFIFLWHGLSAQDISSFGNKNSYNLSGNINLGINYYDISGERPSFYAPYGYQISGHVNGQIGGINIPLQFSLNQNSNSISSPFNLYGASPYYKWIKLHLGYRSLSFSPYIYNGRSFLGIGVELNPGKFNVTAFRGRLKNLLAIRQAQLNETEILPTYTRWVHGARLGYGNRRSRIEIMGVHIEDDPSTGKGALYSPQENIVFGSKAQLNILKRLNLGINASISLLTSDLNATTFETQSELSEQLSTITTLNASSRASWAGDAFINYNYKGYEIGVKGKRINPFYTSLGTNYLVNDIENYTLNATAPFFKNKLRIQGSIGQERDNLLGHKAFTSVRTIGSVAILFRQGQNLFIQGRYNNYQQENESGLYVINDSIRVLTTTSNVMLASQFTILKSDLKEVRVNANIFSNQVIDEVAIEGNQELFTGMGGYLNANYILKEKAFSIGPVFNYQDFKSVETHQKRIGIGVNASKSFFDQKLNASINTIYNSDINQENDDGYFLSFFFNLRYNIQKQFAVNLRLNHNNNQGIISQSYNEWRGHLSFSYRWSLLNQKK